MGDTAQSERKWFTGLKGRDPHDPRDLMFKARIMASAPVNINALPERASVDLQMPPVMDQKMISGCVGWAYVQCENQNRVASKSGRGRRPAVLSPAFVYRECRVIDELNEPGSLEHDWGTYVRNAWKVGNKLGAPLASNYPPKFDAENFADPKQDWVFPPKSVYRKAPTRWIYDDAEKRQALNYLRCTTLAEVLQSVAQGYAVQIGFTVFRSFYGDTGPRFMIPMPSRGEAALGGHSVCVVAYDRTGAEPWFECRNQWGIDAHEGKPNFRLPFRYFDAGYVSDLWTGRAFE